MRLSLAFLTALSIFCLSSSLCLAQATRAKQGSDHWLKLLNDQPGRQERLTAEQVRFFVSSKDGCQDIGIAGFPQTDGTIVLGDLILKDKVYTPLDGIATILQERGFQEASDDARTAIFINVFQQINQPLGIHVYSGEPSSEEDRPQPVRYQRQASDFFRLAIWVCQEPGLREGPEWRQILYIVAPGAASLSARTLQVFHPKAERLRGFPPTLSN